MLDEFGTLPFGIRDFREMWAKSRNELQSCREAFKAAQASAAGQDREQLKDLYVAELRARGLNIPDDEVLDAAIEAHMREVGNLGKLLGSLRHPR
jgi:CHAD domain-containing protein